jgi:hypothetical protein
MTSMWNVLLDICRITVYITDLFPCCYIQALFYIHSFTYKGRLLGWSFLTGFEALVGARGGIGFWLFPVDYYCIGCTSLLD